MKHKNRIKNLLQAAVFCMALLLPTAVFGQEGKSAGKVGIVQVETARVSSPKAALSSKELMAAA